MRYIALEQAFDECYEHQRRHPIRSSWSKTGRRGSLPSRLRKLVQASDAWNSIRSLSIRSFNLNPRLRPRAAHHTLESLSSRVCYGSRSH
ncbi:hypothetical protein CTAM01_00723 [Colletotrichum tamarilloi]|uniref:Transposase n=1 Tax=Colletotrichum tamarilloi TaxID=1209934 RepID=A0ABQ9RS08_9PEZI|nr:uncharacterized protein CTAM01_00723 [Colletotrichum tamarilloi]KAK1511793.1 hypothetical protein CTAM01_00723 [Colletotrichum tamarilloi]